MSTAAMTEPIAEASPRLEARIAGVFWLLTMLTGALATFFSRRLGVHFVTVNLIGDACFVVVTLLLYEIFKAVNRNLSLLAAFFGLAGCAQAVLRLFQLASAHRQLLVFFGFHCLLIGYLILRSTFLPRILGVLMAIAGLGWLTFLSPPLEKALSPYILLSGIIGEGLLTLWLLVFGVNAERWTAQASAQLD
jgi:uncharacterized protein DUF4386